DLELEAHPALLARLSRLRAPGRPVVRRREVDVAAPALSPARDDDARGRRVDVEEQLARVPVEHLRADRDADHDVLALPAVAVLALAVLAVLAAEQAHVREVHERRLAFVGDED